ncbi:hypothetical protein HK096_006282 [Nowakowskiella sp. JEL0078]|nr:hypothetical protein HK096_006282 [Nowakowskiella sp. JEL0078]
MTFSYSDSLRQRSLKQISKLHYPYFSRSKGVIIGFINSLESRSEFSGHATRTKQSISMKFPSLAGFGFPTAITYGFFPFTRIRSFNPFNTSLYDS